ncbi:Cys-tRNA(Pro) deacylase [Brassicibacter mesophilus]|uniref:Cys-tRNA(Pro) deacylase n=1 Tax=Brassicibacter mesophilus TaxID=745119 RepID=UPI003D1A409A
MKHPKTNAMRILDQYNIKYNVITYDCIDGNIDGISVSKKIGKDPKHVYKTLVTKSNSNNIYVFIIPVDQEIDFKKAGKITGEKKIEMIPVKDITKYTGYVRGGCSPFGMKKRYKTYIDSSASKLEKIIVSGGKIGIQIEIDVSDLVKVVEGEMDEIIKDA